MDRLVKEYNSSAEVYYDPKKQDKQLKIDGNLHPKVKKINFLRRLVSKIFGKKIEREKISKNFKRIEVKRSVQDQEMWSLKGFQLFDQKVRGRTEDFNKFFLEGEQQALQLMQALKKSEGLSVEELKKNPLLNPDAIQRLQKQLLEALQKIESDEKREEVKAFLRKECKKNEISPSALDALQH